MPYRLEGDAAWLERWKRDAHPADTDVTLLRAWIDELRADPRQLPSSEAPREHPHVQDELRAAFLLDPGGVFVVYAIDEAVQVVRILPIGCQPPEGVVFRIPI